MTYEASGLFAQVSVLDYLKGTMKSEVKLPTDPSLGTRAHFIAVYSYIGSSEVLFKLERNSDASQTIRSSALFTSQGPWAHEHLAARSTRSPRY